MKSKVIILGLDGLDYELVDKWKLKGLMQVEYGKVWVPINEKVGEPTSPEVWASFSTGKHISNMDFKQPMKLRILSFMRKYVPLKLGLSRKVGGIRRFPELKQKTFLDTIPNSLEINAPYYSFDHATMRIMRKFELKERTAKQIRDELYSLYGRRKKQITLTIRKQLRNVNLIFAYIHILDDIQHYFFLRPEEVERFYKELNHYVSFLKTILPSSILFVIVSDHGFNLRTGKHTNYGFYSSNKPLKPIPCKITDFSEYFMGLV